MSLKPEVSLGVGLAVAAMVGAVYVNATPNLTDIRAAQQNDPDVAAARKVAAWTSTGLVAGVSLLSKDMTVFILGGAVTIAMDWWVRHANAVIPSVGRATVAGLEASVPAATQQAAPADYGYADDMASYVGA